MADPELIQFYKGRVEHAQKLIAAHESRGFRLSLLRLFILIATFVGLFFLEGLPGYIFLSWIVFGIILFLYVVLVQKKSDKIVNREKKSVQINENEISCLSNFENCYYDGNSFRRGDHFYSEDLDVFGPYSLFGLINRCSTYQGHKLLSEWLSTTSEFSEIESRTKAVKDLEQSVDWRHNLANALLEVEDHSLDPSEAIDDLLAQPLDFVKSTTLGVWIRLIPFLWISILVYYFIDSTKAEFCATILASINLLTTFYYGKKVSVVQNSISSAFASLGHYVASIRLIVNHEFTAEYLNEEIIKLRSKKTNASHVVENLSQLKRIIDLLDYRLNMFVGVLLNVLLLWDLRIVQRLENWQSSNKEVSKEIFLLIGKVEAISSLANWSFNHQQYNYASILSADFHFEAIGMSHPLLELQTNIPNDFSKHNNDFITIITGSNMSGKSTFLRTIGLNLILAYAGTRTYARELSASVFELITYMRIKDALEENVSTFKAELNRIELILKELNKGTNALLLIDEMLRGTNSRDKLKGSIGITKKLLTLKAYAIIATHDIKLAELGEEYKDEIKNYFFDINFHDGDLRFDYKIKNGICQNFNASYLISQLGIKMDDDL